MWTNEECREKKENYNNRVTEPQSSFYKSYFELRNVCAIYEPNLQPQKLDDTWEHKKEWQTEIYWNEILEFN